MQRCCATDDEIADWRLRIADWKTKTLSRQSAIANPQFQGRSRSSLCVLALFEVKGSRKNYLAFCCWPPGPLARRERRAIPGVVCEERATKPAGLRAAA